MMKEACKISMINNVDPVLSKLWEFHKLLFENNHLKGDLIYFDSNFPCYLRKMIEKSDRDRLFKLEIGNELRGFIHFKMLADTTFLNNIYVSKSFQGKGIGKYFLKQSLSHINRKMFRYFALDVFLSNKRALSWYKKIDLAVISETKWFKVDGSFSTSNNNGIELDFRKDENGFNSFYIGSNKVGTIVNTTLIVNDLRFIRNLPLKQFEKVISKGNPDDSSPALKFQHIETSIRMRGSLDEVLNNL